MLPMVKLTLPKLWKETLLTKAPLPIKDGGDDDDPEEVGDEGDAPY